MRMLAHEQNVFHIDFRKLLEEKLMPHFNKRLGSDHAEQNRYNDEAALHQPQKIAEILGEIVYPPVDKDEPSISEKELGELESAIKGGVIFLLTSFFYFATLTLAKNFYCS